MTGLEHTFIATTMLAIAFYAGKYFGVRQGRIEGVAKTFDLMSDKEIERISEEIMQSLKEENDG